MSRRPAIATEAELRRVMRAAWAAGYRSVAIVCRRGDEIIRIEAFEAPAATSAGTVGADEPEKTIVL